MFSDIGRKATIKTQFKVMICLGEQDERGCDGGREGHREHGFG